MADALMIEASCGEVAVHAGDTFPLTYPLDLVGRWEVTTLETFGSIYSPSGLGGTPILRCRNVETGEVRDFCGDSVAAAIERDRKADQ